ncbi:NADAR domain-containing protein [Actinomadura meridiana]
MDRIWGIGLTADDPSAEQVASWKGENLLGFALMAARTNLTS